MRHGWLAAAVIAVGIGAIGSALAVAAPVVRAVSPPARVRLALLRTDRARYVVLREVSQSGPVTYEIDNLHDRAATLTDGTVSSIQIRSDVYTPGSTGGCYVSARRSVALLPNIGGMLLPSGVAAVHYRVIGRTVDWKIKTAGGHGPHGIVNVNATGQIVSASVHSGPGVPLRATVSYPTRRPRIETPAKQCQIDKPAHGGADR